MTISDPIGDMLTRIRNAMMAKHAYVLMPSSGIKKSIAELLGGEGYVGRVEEIPGGPQAQLKIQLKYDEERKSLITNLKRVSKPGRRIYKGKDEIPWVLSGVGVAILSTSQGIMTDRQARRQGVGGEVLCYVW
ncbi:MAG: 30S ribosomal protein S8 [Ardenticatenales bacterium]|nr:30S ribosomal protein S8 [Ardenticatenales bacterium]